MVIHWRGGLLRLISFYRHRCVRVQTGRRSQAYAGAQLLQQLFPASCVYSEEKEIHQTRANSTGTSCDFRLGTTFFWPFSLAPFSPLPGGGEQDKVRRSRGKISESLQTEPFTLRNPQSPPSRLRARVSRFALFLQNTMTQSATAIRFRKALNVVVCLWLGGATATSSEFSVNTAAGCLNMGVNEGGCFVCTSDATGKQASGKELEDLCRATCQADSQCKAFETSHENISKYYAAQHPTGLSINCCIEHKAPTNYSNPVTAATATGFCQKEAKCWSSHVVTGRCPSYDDSASACRDAVAREGKTQGGCGRDFLGTSEKGYAPGCQCSKAGKHRGCCYFGTDIPPTGLPEVIRQGLYRPAGYPCPRPAQCVYDATGWAVHDNSKNFQRVRDHVASGCQPARNETLSLLIDAQCAWTRPHNGTSEKLRECVTGNWTTPRDSTGGLSLCYLLWVAGVIVPLFCTCNSCIKVDQMNKRHYHPEDAVDAKGKPIQKLVPNSSGDAIQAIEAIQGVQQIVRKRRVPILGFGLFLLASCMAFHFMLSSDQVSITVSSQIVLLTLTMHARTRAHTHTHTTICVYHIHHMYVHA